MGTICLVIAAILFFCAAMSWALGPVHLIPAGLCFFTLGHLLGGISWPRRSD